MTLELLNGKVKWGQTRHIQRFLKYIDPTILGYEPMDCSSVAMGKYRQSELSTQTINPSLR